MRDAEIHVVAGFGAVLLSVALVVPTVWLSKARAEAGPALDDLETIEAALAYRKPTAKRQPQKPRHAASPEVKPEGVSRDETRRVETTPKDDLLSNDQDPLAKFRRQEDDTEVGAPMDVGDFNGSEFGIGDVTKGDPYFQRLVVDLAWEGDNRPPELAKGSGRPPVGCIHLTSDGKIPETKFKDTSNDDIGSYAERALKSLQKRRNDRPEQVPTHLLRQLTTKWVCFKFSVQAPT